jgi:hypothetical protein
VTCCPGLQYLNVEAMRCSSPAQLAPLQGLSKLHTLMVGLQCAPAGEGLEVVGRMTGLRSLSLAVPGAHKGGLLQLSQLQELTKLTYDSPCNPPVKLTCEVSRAATCRWKLLLSLSDAWHSILQVEESLQFACGNSSVCNRCVQVHLDGFTRSI